MKTKSIESYLLKRLRNPAFAASFIKEYCTKDKEDSPEQHKELLFSGLEAIARAHDLCIIHVKD